MSIWNKVLIGLIIPASLCFIFFAMRALKTHEHWRLAVQKIEKKLGEVQKATVLLREGDEPSKTLGLRQLRMQLHKVTLNRGRIWSNVTPGEFNPQTGILTVTTDLPNPNGIEVQNVLYLFSQAPASQGGRYLGSFTVMAKADKQVQLQASALMTHSEVERLQKSPKPWVMYDVVPVDDREIFAKLDEKAKRALLPQTTVEEYLKDGKAQPDGKAFARQLRDYHVLLASYHRQRSLLFEAISAAKVDNHYLQNALADARKQEQFHNTEINTLKTNLAEEQRQLKAVKDHMKAVEDKLKDVRTGIQQLIEANRSTVGQIAWIQAEATRKIDQRTQGVVQTQ